MAASVEQVCQFLGRIPPHILDTSQQKDLIGIIHRIGTSVEQFHQSNSPSIRRSTAIPVPNTFLRKAVSLSSCSFPNDAPSLLPKSQIYANPIPTELGEIYRRVISEIPHLFETKIGDLDCIIHTNCVIQEAELCVVFFHGLGASPWHFVKVASSFFECRSSWSHEESSDSTDEVKTPSRIRTIFIFPFAPGKMKPGEFGAVRDMAYGSYKWWDIIPAEQNERQPAVRSVGMEQRTRCQPLLQRATIGPINSSDFFESLIRTPVLNKDELDVVSAVDEETAYQNEPNHKKLVAEKSPSVFCCSGGLGRTTVGSEVGLHRLENPAGRMTAVSHALKLLAELEQCHRIPIDSIAIAGFSQGAMLALDVLHYLRRPPVMAALFSAAPMCIDLWKERRSGMSPMVGKAFSEMPILQSHGSNDWVFPVFVGRWLHRFLVRNKWSVRFIEFEGEHELPGPVIEEFHDTLQSVIQQRKTARRGDLGFDVDLIPDNSPASPGGAKKLWERIDEFVYNAGYALASCVLPMANRIC